METSSHVPSAWVGTEDVGGGVGGEGKCAGFDGEGAEGAKGAEGEMMHSGKEILDLFVGIVTNVKPAQVACHLERDTDTRALKWGTGEVEGCKC